MLGSQRLDLGEGLPAGSVAARVLAALDELLQETGR